MKEIGQQGFSVNFKNMHSTVSAWKIDHAYDARTGGSLTRSGSRLQNDQTPIVQKSAINFSGSGHFDVISGALTNSNSNVKMQGSQPDNSSIFGG